MQLLLGITSPEKADKLLFSNSPSFSKFAKRPLEPCG